MLTWRLRSWRVVGAAVLVAVLLVPLAFRGHRHADHGAAPRACAVCLATQHAPALASPLAAAVAPVLAGTATVSAASVAPTPRERPSHAGRAPPFALVIRAG
jgi:hypothetical protein